MLFGVHPWQLMHMDDLKRSWYEVAAMHHLKREHEIRQNFLNALGEMFTGSDNVV